MSTVNSFDKNAHFSELNSPLMNASGGFTTPTARKAAARSNLNVAASFTEHMMDAAFGEQPLVAQQSSQAFNSTGTMTAANLLAFIITSTTAAAVSATLPTGSALETDLVAAYPSLAVNDSFEFVVINTGGTNAFTVVTNTGWTLVGNMVVALSSSGRFRVRRTATNVYTIYRVG